MKTISWFFAFLFGAFLVYATAQIPPAGVSPLSLHLSQRFLQQSGSETGFRSPLGAVLTDYRSFDFLVLVLFFFTLFLALFLFFTKTAKTGNLIPLLLVWAGTALAFGVGGVGLFYGSNFLDYESLALWLDPTRARVQGALILAAGVLLSLGGLFLLSLRWIQSPEDSRER